MKRTLPRLKSQLECTTLGEPPSTVRDVKLDSEDTVKILSDGGAQQTLDPASLVLGCSHYGKPLCSTLASRYEVAF